LNISISRSTMACLRRLLPGAIAASLLVATAQPASAKMGALVFVNNAKLCAYVTIYHSTTGEPDTWKAATGTLGPRYVKAGANFAGSVDWSYVKVRAEVTRNDYCTGGTIVDVDATYHDTSTVAHVQRQATLQSDTRFYITIR